LGGSKSGSPTSAAAGKVIFSQLSGTFLPSFAYQCLSRIFFFGGELSQARTQAFLPQS
jgi:hypothetical protein